MNNFITLALIHFLGVISPGQDFIGISRYSLSNSIKKSCKFAFGISIGQSVYIFLSVFGIMEIVFSNNIIYNLFCIFSGFYLFYLAFQMIKPRENKIVEDSKALDKKNVTLPIKSGFLLTITNPKAPIFYASILLNFIEKDASDIYMLGICIYMSIMTFVYFSIIACIFTIFKNKIMQYVYIIEKIFALFLGYFGGKLLYSLI